MTKSSQWFGSKKNNNKITPKATENAVRALWLYNRGMLLISDTFLSWCIWLLFILVLCSSCESIARTSLGIFTCQGSESFFQVIFVFLFQVLNCFQLLGIFTEKWICTIVFISNVHFANMLLLMFPVWAPHVLYISTYEHTVHFQKKWYYYKIHPGQRRDFNYTAFYLSFPLFDNSWPFVIYHATGKTCLWCGILL